MYFRFQVLLFLLFATVFCFGQKKDSLSTTKQEIKSKQEANDSTAWLRNDTSSVKNKKHSPRRATILSIICPGLGQVYNRQYWKVPILGGLGVFFGIMIASNNHDYQNARKDYRIRLENEADPVYQADRSNKTYLFDPTRYDAYDPNNPENILNKVRTYNTAQLRLTRDTYRRDRDFYIIMSGLVYALNIIDATVFAHLREFEVSDKLSMRIDPDIKLASNTQPYAGLSCSLLFKK